MNHASNFFSNGIFFGRTKVHILDFLRLTRGVLESFSNGKFFIEF